MTVRDEDCGDWPAPCNCDDPTTHDGHNNAKDNDALHCGSCDWVWRGKRARFGDALGIHQRIAHGHTEPTYQYAIFYPNGVTDGLGGDPKVLSEILRSGDRLMRRVVGEWEEVDREP